jgi:hypothetical protein
MVEIGLGVEGVVGVTGVVGLVGLVGVVGLVGEVIEAAGVEGALVLPSAGAAGAGALALQRLFTLLYPEAQTQAVPLQISFSLLQGLAWMDTFGADEAPAAEDPVDAVADPVEAVAEPVDAVAEPVELLEVAAAGAELEAAAGAASWVLLQAFLDPG